MAGAVELDRPRIRQSGDEMIGRVRSVEMAVGAVDDERRLDDAAEQRASILFDERVPEGAGDCGVGPSELGRRPGRECAAPVARWLGEDRRPGPGGEAGI